MMCLYGFIEDERINQIIYRIWIYFFIEISLKLISMDLKSLFFKFNNLNFFLIYNFFIKKIRVFFQKIEYFGLYLLDIFISIWNLSNLLS